MVVTMLRIPSKALSGFKSKAAPIFGIKGRGAFKDEGGFPPVSPTSGRKSTVNRKSFVLEHCDSHHLDEEYDITPGKELGAGGFGTVRRASLKGATTVTRAIKTVAKSDMKAEQLVRREIAIMRYLDHPCICRLIETFENKKNIYLVLELIDGRELFDEIAEQRSLDEVWAAGIMQQVFGALHYCHGKNVIHRDLKPENIMIRHSHDTHSRREETRTHMVPQVTLIDFGMAMVHKGLSVAGEPPMGTTNYVAPEAMRGRCTFASDVWSVGMVLHALLVGRLPTPCEVRGNEPITTLAGWENVSLAAKELVQGLLLVDTSTRMTAAKAAEHPWTQGVASVFLSPKQASRMMKNFQSFHSSTKLRRAALTALAMQLTSQQLADHGEQFVSIDSDGNGRISKQELIDSISAASPLSREEIRSWAESVFASVDTDGNEEIDYTEWLAAAGHEATCRSEETMRAAFRVFDVDGDGKIDEAEFARVVAQTPAEIASLLPEFDTNGDGVIDFEEFKNLLQVGVADAACGGQHWQPCNTGNSGFTNLSGNSGTSRGKWIPPNRLAKPLVPKASALATKFSL